MIGGIEKMRHTWELLVLSAQFFCKPKIAQKFKFIEKKKKSPTWKGREAQLNPAFWSPLLRHSFTWVKPSWNLQPSTKWISSSVYGQCHMERKNWPVKFCLNSWISHSAKLWDIIMTSFKPLKFGVLRYTTTDIQKGCLQNSGLISCSLGSLKEPIHWLLAS